MIKPLPYFLTIVGLGLIAEVLLAKRAKALGERLADGLQPYLDKYLPPKKSA